MIYFTVMPLHRPNYIQQMFKCRGSWNSIWTYLFKSASPFPLDDGLVRTLVEDGESSRSHFEFAVIAEEKGD